MVTEENKNKLKSIPANQLDIANTLLTITSLKNEVASNLAILLEEIRNGQEGKEKVIDEKLEKLKKACETIFGRLDLLKNNLMTTQKNVESGIERIDNSQKDLEIKQAECTHIVYQLDKEIKVKIENFQKEIEAKNVKIKQLETQLQDFSTQANSRMEELNEKIDTNRYILYGVIAILVVAAGVLGSVL